MNIFPLDFTSVRSGSVAAALIPERTVLSSAALFGVAIVSVLPALFWTLMIWAVSSVFGWNVSATALTTVAAAIALFLSVVCSAIIAAA